ncbi:hypothetical protein [Sorangium sp. So ce381]|uniref:hypothetical protein n=1 Tax=unclassified Sorangium TaxID=2621164 RepID=UPI003F5B1F63
MDHLFDLLTELSIDPFKQNELLTDEERAALEQRGSPEVQAAIADGAWTRCAGLFDPGPDPNEDEDPDPADLRDRSPHAFQNDRHHAAR